MALTCHYYSENSNRPTMVHKCLEVTPFKEISHTGENLKNFLLEVLEDWNIESKVFTVVRDNGTDITAAVDKLPYVGIPCVAHTLQLVIKDGMAENALINKIVKKAKKLVGSYKHSRKYFKMLKNCQTQLQLPQHRLIQDEPTRWNTTYHMLKRILEQKEALILVDAKPETKIAASLTNEEFKTIECAVEIFEVFENATLQVSKSSSTISEVIPLVYTIQHVIDSIDLEGSGLMRLKNDIMASIKRRYAGMEKNLTYACATLVDPRFKSKPFKNEEDLQSAKQTLIEEMKRLSPQVQAETTASQSSTEMVSDCKKKKGLWSHYKELFGDPSDATVSEKDIYVVELQNYLEEKTLDPKLADEVPRYWQLTNFKHLKNVAMKYMCIPASTVFSERLFSTAGNICDRKRNRLDPDRVKMLVFLNRNLS